MGTTENRLKKKSQSVSGNHKLFSDYQSLQDHLDQKARQRGIPLHGQFELTPLCNFNCEMCYVHMKPEQMSGRNVLSVETWKRLMLQAWQAGMINVTLTGGECLTYPGFDEIYLFLLDLGCQVEILTNGYLLDEKRIQFFLRYQPSNIQVTLYGQNDEVYKRVTGVPAFHVVQKNIAELVKSRIPFNISLTPNRYLGEDIYQTVRAAKKMHDYVKANILLFDPREETGRSGQNAEVDLDMYIRVFELLWELKGEKAVPIAEKALPETGGPSHEKTAYGIPCSAGRSAFTITWDGKMIPCNRLPMIEGYPLRDGFVEAWKSINQSVSKWVRTPECEGCAYEETCLHCPGDLIRFAVPGKKPEVLCQRAKVFVQHGIWDAPDCK